MLEVAAASGLAVPVVAGREVCGFGIDIAPESIVGEQGPDGSVAVRQIPAGTSVCDAQEMFRKSKAAAASNSDSGSGGQDPQGSADFVHRPRRIRLRVGPYPLHPEVAKDVRELVAIHVITGAAASASTDTSSGTPVDPAAASQSHEATAARASHQVAAMAWRYAGGHPGEMLLLLRACESIVEARAREQDIEGKQGSISASADSGASGSGTVQGARNRSRGKVHGDRWWKGRSSTDRALLLVDRAWSQIVDARMHQLRSLFVPQGEQETGTASSIVLPGGTAQVVATDWSTAASKSGSESAKPGSPSPSLGVGEGDSLEALVSAYACLAAVTGFMDPVQIPQVRGDSMGDPDAPPAHTTGGFSLVPGRGEIPPRGSGSVDELEVDGDSLTGVLGRLDASLMRRWEVMAPSERSSPVASGMDSESFLPLDA